MFEWNFCMERILQAVAHNFEYMGWQHWVTIVALEHSNCSDPQMTPCQCWLVWVIFGHFFWWKVQKFLWADSAFPGPPKSQGSTTWSPSHHLWGPFFCTSGLSVASSAEKEKKGRERTPTKLSQTVRLHQQLCTHTSYTGKRKKEGGRTWYSQLSIL